MNFEICIPVLHVVECIVIIIIIIIITICSGTC
jgi:hypothetical protein